MTAATKPTEHCPACTRSDRRTFLAATAAGLAVAMAGFTRGATAGPARARTRGRLRAAEKPAVPTPTTTEPPTTTTTVSPPATTTGPPAVRLDAVPAPRPGAAQAVFTGPTGADQIAITIDDGLCAGCAEFYVNLAQTTGIHLTLSPNGVYRAIWEPLAPVLRSMIEQGQVQIGNHTYSHANLLSLSNSDVEAQIVKNDRWIEDTFGITARPWFRPPYGFHDARTDAVAGDLGYTKILLWNGSFGDSTSISAAQLLNLAGQFLKPGTIMLGHANYPTIESLWGQIRVMIAERGLTPVTLDEMFGTSRNAG